MGIGQSSANGVASAGLGLLSSIGKATLGAKSYSAGKSAADAISESNKSNSTKTDYLDENEEGAGLDMRMAEKSRTELAQKIKAIYTNNELSERARSRRLNKALKEGYSDKGGLSHGK